MLKNKKRLSIPLSLDIYDRLNEDADRLGVSQAAYAAYIIGNHYNQLDINLNATSNAFEKVLETIFKGSGIDYKELYRKGIESGYNAMDTVLSKQLKKDEEK